jgi:microcin-processing peptidase 2. Unknown type peptidase. MEROPS family U62
VLEASRAARAIAQDGRGAGKPLALGNTRSLYPAIDPVESLPNPDKIALLREVDAYARSRDPRITQVIVSLAATLDTILIAASDGTLAADVRPLVRINVQVIAEANGRREQGYAGGGGRYGYGELIANGRALAFADEAVRQALVNLDRSTRPAGNMTVVLGPGWPGVLLHEAIGHGLKATSTARAAPRFPAASASAWPPRASPSSTTARCRPPRLAQHRRRGTPTRMHHADRGRHPGGYMQDKLNARLMGMAPTGNGRRESFTALPMPRMTNTYMRGGSMDPGRDHPLGEEGPVRAQLRRRPGRHHQRQVHLLRQRGYLIEDGRSPPRSRAPP